MISENLTTEKRELQEFAPIPEDVYTVELLDITDKRVPQYNDKTQMETVLDFQFVILEGTGQDLKPLRGRNVWRNFVPNAFYESKKGKNATMQIVEAIYGRTLEDVEYASFNYEKWNDLIGKQLRVVIENKTVGDKTYSNIASFLPAKEKYNSLTEEEKEKSTVKKKEEVEEYPEIVTDGI